MRHRTHAFRRAAAAAVLGMGMTAGVIGLSAGIAGAATATNTISAAPKLEIPSTGSNQPAADLTVTLVNTGSAKLLAASTLTLTLTVTGTVTWTAPPVVSSNGVTVTSATGTATPTLTITLGAMTAGATATVSLTNVHYSTTTATGTIKVTPIWTGTLTGGSATAFNPTFTPSYAVNAYATHVTPPTPATVTSATAATTPNLKATGAGQAAGNWTISFTTVTKGDGWNTGETISLTVQNPAGNNCGTATEGYVLFTGTPSATVSATHVTATPTVAIATSAGTTCSAVSHNKVTVTFTNTGMFTATTPATNTMSIVLSGVKYHVAAGTTPALGNVTVTARLTINTTTTLIATSTSTPATTTGLSNGTVTSVYVTANTPAVTVAPSAYDASISPVNVVENTAGTVTSGYVCVSLHTAATDHFNASATATASVTGGNGAVTATVFYENTAGTAVTSGNATYAVFEVTGASTTTTTYSVSGLAVNASATPAAVMVTVFSSATATTGNCTSAGTPYGVAVAYTIGTTSTRIAGATAAGTAAKELEHTFPATGISTSCVGDGSFMTTRPVVVATETHFQDALSSQYLAGFYKTGTLLTQTSSLPSVTVAALRTEGVSRVFVVGGTLAVSSTVVNQLKSLPVYNCGGTSLTLTMGTGSVSHIKVTRIYGYTAADTAMEIAQAVPKSHIATLSLAGAYAGVNATGGNGMYNDTPAKASTGPSVSGPLSTAIVASGTEFQDAMAASAFAYSATGTGGVAVAPPGVPILLTTPAMLSTAAADALVNLTIQQVILMGGTDAVSNQVVTGLQTMGISVLRVAGMSYTDTAVQLAKFLVNTGTTGAGWTIGAASAGIGTVTVTRGNGYTDGLAGAVISGYTGHPLLLTQSPTAVGSSLTAFLKASGATTTGIATTGQTITALIVFGGTLAVTPAVVTQMQADIA